MIKGIYKRYVDDTVTLTSFNFFNNLDKGKFLIRQHMGLINSLAPFITISDLISTDFYLDRISVRMPIINQYVKKLNDLYKYWLNSIDKNSTENKKILNILMWLRGETKLLPDTTLSDIVFMLSSNESSDTKYKLPVCADCFINAKFNSVLATFYMMSKFLVFTDSKIEFNNLDTLVATYGKEIENSLYLETSEIPVPIFFQSPEDNDIILELGVVRTQEFKISLLDIFNAKNKSLLEITLLNTFWNKNNLDIILGIISSFNLGLDNSSDNNLIEKVVLYIYNLFYNIPFYGRGPEFNKNNSSLFNTINTVISKNNIDISNCSEYGFTEPLVNNETEEVETVSISQEAMDLLNKTQKIISTISMAEEDEEETDTDEEEEEIVDDEEPESDEDTNEDDTDSDEDNIEEDDGSSLDDESYDDDSDVGSNDNSNEPPKNKNANTSSLRGIKLELDFNPTLDSIVFKRELSVWINNLLNDEKLSEDQKLILENIKNKWMALLSVNTLVDWIERSINRTIIKKN